MRPIHTLVFVSSTALISISILLWVVLRRIGDVLLTLVPLLLAGVVTLEICALIDFPLNFAKAGRYRIALSQDAWINLVQKGVRLKTADHARGAACSGIAKVVAYDLQPGRYWLQLSEAKEPSIGVMVVSAPK